MLDRNWRCSIGELDLVVRDGTEIVFVEVKARASDRYGPPASAVGLTKQRTLRRLAARWLAEHDDTVSRRDGIRFDVVAVTGAHVEVIEAAF